MKDQSFKALQQKWYRKLKRSGFVDIEAPQYQHMKAKESTWHILNWDPEDAASIQRYYELARQMLHEHPFSSNKEKLVWKCHSEGMSYNAIAGRTELSIDFVRGIIERLALCIKNNT